MKPTSLEDTIAAISTPPGEGGIGIVRLSGENAIPIVRGIFHSASGRDVIHTGRVFYGDVRDGETVLDEVLVHVMRAPHSYTREDVVEINGHGGAAPLNAILELVLRQGARLAGPGEFTRRAFLNGRIDLTQAEAVIDRIRAQTRAGLQAASAAAGGALSQAIHRICDTLRMVKSQIEAAIDFPDQDVPELITPELHQQVKTAREEMAQMLANADAGRIYREGAAVAIAGKPNVGKSSLFNALLRDARAIVTPHAGTTRDLLEEVIAVKGIPIRLTDTAGLRDTLDDIERLGVEAARRALTRSAAVLLVMDTSRPLTNEDKQIHRECGELGVPVLFVWNKIDLAPAPNNGHHFGAARQVSVSATTGQGLTQLEDTLAELLLGGNTVAPDQSLITRIHQKDSLRRALEAVDRLLENFSESPELLAIEIDEALHALGEITGETTPDDILERIFASFCIGK